MNKKLKRLLLEESIIPEDGGWPAIRRIEIHQAKIAKIKYDYFINEYWLGQALRNVIEVAIKARGNAYAPHSNYKVGAAVLTANWKIYAGCNVEQATLRTTHAEKNAIDTMVANGDRGIIALVCISKNGGIPCAECRQSIWEFSGKDKNVWIVGINPDKKEVSVTKIKDLYPWPFGPEDLKVDPIQ